MDVAHLARHIRWFASSLSLAVCLSQTARAATTALQVPADDSWIGYDGTWSPVTIQIGTPPQSMALLPSTSGQETLVVGLNGCDDTFKCRSLRGGLFAANESSSFRNSGNYDLGLAPQLGLDSTAYYGLDTVSFDPSTNETTQLVAVVNGTDYWIGTFGLGIDNTTIGTRQTSSFLSSLFQNAQIPSQSFGYTAGASYRLKQVPSSLTLGGYDENRLEPNGVSFALSSDALPVLAINSIIMNGMGDINLTSETEPALFTVDSTTPFLWLPERLADRFGNALGLEYDEPTGSYLYSNSGHLTDLKAANLSFEFGLADVPGERTKLTLSILGDAFLAHSLSYGFPGLDISETDDPIPYFPIRKAVNDTQYTIGRCFLQETYLMVNYDSNNFSLSQAKFSLDAVVNTNLVDITSPSNSIGSGETTVKGTSTRLAPGAIAGIVIGILAIIAAVITCIVVIMLYRRRSRHPSHKGSSSSSTSATSDEALPRRGLARLFLGAHGTGQKVSELPAREHDPATSLASNGLFSRRNRNRGRAIAEVDFANEINELPTPLAFAAELPGSPVPERRGSMAKTITGIADAKVDPEVVPPYDIQYASFAAAFRWCILAQSCDIPRHWGVDDRNGHVECAESRVNK